MLQREFTTCLNKNPQKNYDKDNGDDIVIVLIIFNATWAGAPNENIVQNHLNIELFSVF